MAKSLGLPPGTAYFAAIRFWCWRAFAHERRALAMPARWAALTSRWQGTHSVSRLPKVAAPPNASATT